MKIVAHGTHNPNAQDCRINIDAIHFSSESDIYNFPSGTGPTGVQRMILGYPKRQDYKDKDGDLWRPATEIVSRLPMPKGDNVAQCWMKETRNSITATPDPELYRYGYRAGDFWVNVTV